MANMIIVYLFFILQIPQEGVSSDATLACDWTWSTWTECDPGLCNTPRYEKDRFRIIKQAPLQRMNQSCNFGIVAISPSKVPQDNIQTWIESEKCETGEPCYWANQTCGTTTGSDVFQCHNGYCIPASLVKNGDNDCEDNSDEFSHLSGINQRSPCRPADSSRQLPNTDVWSHGRDILFRKKAQSVLNAGFYGTCELTPDLQYRKQYNVYSVSNFEETPKRTTISYFPNWVSFAKNLQTVLGFSQEFSEVYNKIKDFENVTFHEAVRIIPGDVIKIKPPDKLLLHPGFERDLRSLPKLYSYKKYFTFLDKYGTHFVQQAAIGGVFRIYLGFDKYKYDLGMIQQALHNLIEYLNGNDSLEDSYHILRRARIQKFVVTGGKTRFSDLNSLTLRTLDQQLYRDWLESLKFYPDLIHATSIDPQSNATFLPISRLLESQNCFLDNKINIWENLEMAIKDYQHPFINEHILCKSCPNPEKAFLVPDLLTSQSSRGYGCVCYTEDGRTLQEVIETSPVSTKAFASRIAMIVVACLLVIVLLFVFIDWRLKWRLTRCESKTKHVVLDDNVDTPERETLTRNGPSTNGTMRLSTMLPEPEITLTEVDESGTEHHVSTFSRNRLIDQDC